MSQNDILVWWADNARDETLEVKPAYERYVQDTEYDGEKDTFRQLVNKLNNNGLMDRVERGVYRINQHGKARAEWIKTGGDGDSPDTNDEIRAEVVDVLRTFSDDIDAAAAQGEPYNLPVSTLDKSAPSPALVDTFAEQPATFLEELDRAANQVTAADTATVQLDVDTDRWMQPIYKARSGKHVGTPVTITGTVESTSKIHQEIISATFRCTACGAEYDKEQDSAKLKSPYKCDCGNKEFEPTERVYKDVIELTVGNFSGENDDLKAVFRTREIDKEAKDTFRAGNEIRVTGILRERQQAKDSPKLNPYLEIISYRRLDKRTTLEDVDEETIQHVKAKVDVQDEPFKAFARSIAPNIVGQDTAKEVVAAGLIGGAPQREEHGEIRDDGRIHTLLLGNPGLGKSDILKYVREVFPKAFYADAKNATGVGLTATVEKDDHDTFRLKAGKLVFADQGVLALDEFDKMAKADAERLNTAMTSPTFPVDKASITAELPGQATVIASGNYENYVDEYMDVLDNIPDHAESLLDRFALTYAVRRSDKEEQVEDAILGGWKDNRKIQDPPFSTEEQVVYRELARSRNPVLTDEAASVLKEWLDAQRDIAASKENPAFRSDSYRYVGTAAKLTTMFARSRLADEATASDARNAIDLLTRTRQSLGLAEGESDVTKKEDRKNAVAEVRDEIKRQTEGGDPVEQYEVIQAVSISEEKAEDALERLKNDGEVYSPRSGQVSIT